MEASDIATSESRSDELGKGKSFICFPFCRTGVRRVTRLVGRAKTYSRSSIVKLSIKLPLESHGVGEG